MIEQHIRERAYYIWEGEGRVHGRAQAHWLQAESELTARQADAAEAVAADAAGKAKVAKAPAKTAAKGAGKDVAKDVSQDIPKKVAKRAAAPKAARRAPRTPANAGIALH